MVLSSIITQPRLSKYGTGNVVADSHGSISLLLKQALKAMIKNNKLKNSKSKPSIASLERVERAAEVHRCTKDTLSLERERAMIT
jgi:hypothetical protein